MSRIQTLACAAWSDAVPSGTPSEAVTVLEAGNVLFLPLLPFVVERREDEIFSPGILSSSKNASFDPASGRVGGTTLSGAALDGVRELMARFSSQATALVGHLLPSYVGRLMPARASFRPAEVEGRQTSWRKDDTRLHVDSFPATPVQGRRILRVFSNVNPSHRARSWRVGGDFEAVAQRFAASLIVPRAWQAVVLRVLGMTKSRRTPYDALMLQLHDRMKQDHTFQTHSEQEVFDFPAGSTWVSFTDEVSHAAVAGQYQLEQTFLLPVEAMIDPRRSPLRVLERLKGRPLS